MGSGPNAENNGEKTLPFLRVPSAANVEFGHAAEQRKNAIRFGYPTLHQDVRKPVRRGAERRVAKVANLVVTTNPAQRQLVAATGQDMSIDRLMRDVEPAIRQTIE